MEIFDNHITEEITPHSIANEVRLERQYHAAPIFIYEGPTDAKLFGRILSDIDKGMVIAHGKENLVGAVGILDAEGSTAGYLGIIDSDFDKIIGFTSNSINLVRTDTHDLELLIFFSDASRGLIEELSSEKNIKDFEQKFSGSFREVILDIAKYVGFYRLVSTRDAFHIDFKDINYDFINLRGLVVDEVRLRRMLTPRLPAQNRHRAVELETAVDNASKSHYDNWQICCGDDVVSVLGRALRRELGNLQFNQADPKFLSKVLRLSFSRDDLTKTNLWGDILKWSVRSGYSF